MKYSVSAAILGIIVSASASFVACSPSPSADLETQRAAAVEAAACSIEYKVISQWDSGFTGEVSFTNSGPAALSGWEVSWDFADGQTVSAAWDGELKAAGPGVRVGNPSWASEVPVGTKVHFGFNGTSGGTNGAPKNLAINGVKCGESSNPPSADGDAGPPSTADSGTTPPSTDGPVVAPPDGQRVVAYFTAWGIYGRNYQVTDIPADKVTHINYAFANVSADGECVLGDAYADIDKAFTGDSWDNGALRGNFNQLKKLKASHPGLKTLISVGGWTWSGKFSDAFATAAGRTKFATSCVTFMTKYGFDGIDIDWEYPVGGGLAGNSNRPEDKANYTLALSEIRRQLDALNDGQHHLLTIAAPAGQSTIAHLDLPALAGPLDWINVMTYDFHGGWETTSNFNAPLTAMSGDTTKLTVSDAIETFLGSGVAPKKVVMGVPFYGRGWAGVSGGNNGLLQPTSGLPKGTWEDGMFDYKDLATNYVGKAGFTRYWNAEAKVPWLYNASTKVMISYDDAESMGLKAAYIKSKGLGGGMFWELSGDDGTLLNALNAGMR